MNCYTRTRWVFFFQECFSESRSDQITYIHHAWPGPSPLELITKKQQQPSWQGYGKLWIYANESLKRIPSTGYSIISLIIKKQEDLVVKNSKPWILGYIDSNTADSRAHSDKEKKKKVVVVSKRTYEYRPFASDLYVWTNVYDQLTVTVTFPYIQYITLLSLVVYMNV